MANQKETQTMQFLLTDTFTTNLAKLTGQEQKVVKTTAFDLQLSPAHPGMQFHKLGGAGWADLRQKASIIVF